MERISKVFTGRCLIDEDLMDDLEEELILSDVGGHHRRCWTGCAAAPLGGLRDQQELMTMLREEVLGLITRDEGSAPRTPPSRGPPRQRPARDFDCGRERRGDHVDRQFANRYNPRLKACCAADTSAPRLWTN